MIQRSLIALAVSYAFVLLSSLSVLILICLVAVGQSNAPSRLHLRIGFLVALFAFTVLTVLEKFFGKYAQAGIVYFGPTYALLGACAVLVGIAGYMSLTSIWRYAPTMLCVWGMEHLYLWYNAMIVTRHPGN